MPVNNMILNLALAMSRNIWAEFWRLVSWSRFVPMSRELISEAKTKVVVIEPACGVIADRHQFLCSYFQSKHLHTRTYTNAVARS